MNPIFISGILSALLPCSLLVIAACLRAVHEPSWLALLTVPITFLYANLVEYLGVQCRRLERSQTLVHGREVYTVRNPRRRAGGAGSPLVATK